jgi:tripartite ATP-independent transporter DctM subunit
MDFLHALPNRLYGIIDNTVLIAVPLFIFMGVMLEKSSLAENLLNSMSQLLRNFKGGLSISVVIVGMLLAASTGIVGATVVTMGLISLPTMLKQGYSPSLASGTICATGTLGQIIPPSIALVLLGDIIANSYQQAQLAQGIFAPKAISVGDLFLGAVVPGMLLIIMYIVYLILVTRFVPQSAPIITEQKMKSSFFQLLKPLMPPIILIFSVLGSILFGLATPTEAAGIGAIGAILLTYNANMLSCDLLKMVAQKTTEITSMIFLILIGASIFSLVFRGFGGDQLVEDLLKNIPGGLFGATFLIMLLIFLLGFILDFIEITYVVVPIVAPALLGLGLDPIWLGIMIAVNLQTSFLTPPFGFSLFYLKGVAPNSVHIQDIYKGVMPFIAIQIILMVQLAIWPSIATWLPSLGN